MCVGVYIYLYLYLTHRRGRHYLSSCSACHFDDGDDEEDNTGDDLVAQGGCPVLRLWSC